jgi:stress response protein SCP2
MQLTKGANAPLTSSTVTITVTGAAVDLCALLITSDRRVRSDADLVFYNQPASTCGHVRLQDPARIRVLLDGLAPEIETVVVAAALDDTAPGGFGAHLPVAVTVQDGPRELHHEVEGVNTERCIVLVEVYRRGATWKLRAVSQGWDTGLVGLVTEFGVEVEQGSAPTPPAQARTPAPAPARAVSPAPLSPLVVELQQRVQAGIAVRRATTAVRPNPSSWLTLAPRGTRTTSNSAARRAEAQARTAQLQATIDYLDGVLAHASALPNLADEHLLMLADASVSRAGRNGRWRLLGRRATTPTAAEPSEYLAPALAELRRRAGTPTDTEAVAAWVRLCTQVADLPATLGQVEHVYVTAGKLVVDVALADRRILPTAHRAKYTAATGTVDDVPMPAKERTAHIERLFAAAALAQAAAAGRGCIAVALPADLTVVVNGWEWANDPATGRPGQVCRVSIATTPAQLAALDLAHVDPVAGVVRGLHGQLSSERPVTPLAHRCGRDTVAGATLDLTSMDPFAFEQLVADLAEAMGFTAERTSRSADGGVDVYVRSTDPLVAGTMIISAKRYKHTVDPKYVRELYGAVNHERAMKGILITTSGFGASAYQFAQGKPLQLVDGAQLREWLVTYLNVSVA